ncbi:MAG: recombinase family protein [Planctomycetota bacterium]|nr:recombinase family protein [Planctomycetota bacterium]
METKQAVGYVRVSTAGQAGEGISLEAQRAKIEAWAAANDHQLLAIHTDAGISGGRTENRPGLQAALADACQHKAAVVVYSLSRLARSTKDAITISEKLEKAGADLVSLSERIDTTSAAGKMVFRMLAVLAEFERDQIAERTSAALQHLRSQRRLVGEVPYGWTLADDKQTLLPLETEQAIIRKIKALRQKGLSYGKIAKLLTIIRAPAKQGNHWWPKVVRTICRANPIEGGTAHVA